MSKLNILGIVKGIKAQTTYLTPIIEAVCNGYIVAEKNGKLLVCSLKEEQRIKEFENNICQIKHQIIINE